MIAWPRAPFRVSPSPNGCLVYGLGLCLLVSSLGLLVLLAVTDIGRQPVLSLLASAGLGETVAAAPKAVSCSARGRTTRTSVRTYACVVTVVDASGREEDLVVHGLSGIDPARVGRIARIDGELAAALSPGTVVVRAIPLALGIGFAAVMARVALTAMRVRRRARRLAQLGRTGRIVEVDLLRWRILGRDRHEYFYAFDHDGTRRHARDRLHGPPLHIDIVETRGAALVGPDGESRLLDHGLDPIRLPDDEMHRLGESIMAERAARPLYRTPALEALVAGAREGPERRYLQAWLDAWTEDEGAHRAAIERRHCEEFHLPPERVDALLREARRAATL